MCLPRKAVSQKNHDWRKADRILIHRKYRVTSEYHKYSLELPNIIRSWLCYVISNQHVVSEETQKQTTKIKAAIVSACVTQGQCRDSWCLRRQYKWRYQSIIAVFDHFKTFIKTIRLTNVTLRSTNLRFRARVILTFHLVRQNYDHAVPRTRQHLCLVCGLLH